MSKEAEIFRQRARQRMEELDIGPSEVARRVKEPASNTSMYLNGKRNPKPEKIQKYAEALECDADWLVGREASEAVRHLPRSPFENAAEILAAYLPDGDRKSAVDLLLTCDDDVFEGVLGGLRPFLKAHRKAKNVTAG